MPGTGFIEGFLADGFSALLSTAGLVPSTTAELHVYADGTLGNDANDGLSSLTPKKTLQAVFDLVPFLVKHNTCVHLSGTFTLADYSYSTLVKLAASGVIVVDGGPNVTVVADNGGSPWVADIGSTTSIGLTTAGWTTDAYAGYMVQIMDGAAAGETRMIQGNSTTTITPCTNFTTSPNGTQFRIVRPETTITSTNSAYVYAGHSKSFGANIQVQRLYFAGKAIIGAQPSSPGYVYLAGTVSNSNTLTAITASFSGLYIAGYIYNPSTFTYYTGTGAPRVGLGQVHASGRLALQGSGYILLQESFVKSAVLASVLSYSISGGSRILSITANDCRRYPDTALTSPHNIKNDSGFATTKIGGGTIGLSLQNSSCFINTGVDLSGSSSHGIEANRSYLYLLGVAGSSNGGAGVYAHSGSVIHTKSGSPPTLTGSLGDLTTDGTTPAGTWTEVESGTKIMDLNESTLIKKVS